ncbi:MAG: DUF2062 domain-containing protein [Pseudomonadota bacterium]
MVFKRRDRRPVLRVLRELVWPRGGWARALAYLKHRLRRIPDRPERIARGIWAGLFVTFTPFVGLHFIVALIVAFFMRANILAALIATFLSNPVTLAPIAWLSLRLGYWMLGIRPEAGLMRNSLDRFGEAMSMLWKNFKSIFTPAQADWAWLPSFFQEIFYPYLIGGILPGLFVAYAGYFASVPVIRAYQNRRKGMLAAKIAELRERAKKEIKDEQP